MHPSNTSRPVVVGVDGSPPATAALDWALDEACSRSARLWLVHALGQAHSDAFTRANPVFVAEERRAAEEILDTAVTHARAVAPGLDIRAVLLVGDPAAILLAEAKFAELVVLGSRGRGGFAGLLLGSTSLKVAMQAGCPVVVLRPPTDAGGARPSAGRIVVGADGSPCSEPALRFGFTRAQRRGLGLTVVRVWHSPAIYIDVPSYQWEQMAKQERVTLEKDLAWWREQFPEVDVVERTVLGNVAATLLDESVGAELLVVGSHGRGGVGGLLLGSVSHTALHHARCPVAVVRRSSSAANASATSAGGAQQLGRVPGSSCLLRCARSRTTLPSAVAHLPASPLQAASGRGGGPGNPGDRSDSG
jgi:nucleotide-binding universal stress UspA family protein